MKSIVFNNVDAKVTKNCCHCGMRESTMFYFFFIAAEGICNIACHQPGDYYELICVIEI